MTVIKRSLALPERDPGPVELAKKQGNSQRNQRYVKRQLHEEMRVTSLMRTRAILGTGTDVERNAGIDLFAIGWRVLA
jgi:hypothetical protein